MIKPINLFDFDHTIYDGDVSLDFFLFSIQKHPLIVRYLPAQAWHMFLYLASLNNRKQFKEHFFIFLKDLRNVDEDVERFWMINEPKIKTWYTTRTHTRDVVVSASPEFLIAPVAKKMGIKKLIATRMDRATGKITGKNCRGPEKVMRLKAELPDVVIDQCYSDSVSDLPILNLANNSYIVRKNKITAYSEYKPSKIKQHFVNKRFPAFIFVGGLNALIGLTFAFIASIFLNNKTVAFMIGYWLGLIPSYFLNSAITFRNRHYDVKTFVRYCISYIPNFFIQTSCVGILIEILHINNAVAYVTAVMIGVPITFVIVSMFAIKNKEANS